MIPIELSVFFWDVNPRTFDPLSYPLYTLARLLEFGDERAVAWMIQAFSPGQIREVVRSERRLTRRSANFWALVYGIPIGEVAALCGGGRPSP
jgi:hypothetical protein